MAWRVKLAPLIQFLVVFCAGWINRELQALIEYQRVELAVWKEVQGGRRVLLNYSQRRRLAVAGAALGRAALSKVTTIVTPDTILRWFRTLEAKKYATTPTRRPGRPRVTEEITREIMRFARENDGWGYTRIRDALDLTGREVSRSTVVRVLAGNGVVPAPERRRRVSWQQFLATHLDGLFGADFFTVEVLTMRGLVRYFVLFFMEIKTRRVHVAGVTCDPSEEWMLQVARNLTDAVDGFLRSARNVIVDRDPLYTREFRRMLKACGITILTLPRRSPNLNAYVERWVRSIRSECLDRIVPLGERHLRRAIAEYVVHYNNERPHQALDGRLVVPAAGVGACRGPTFCRMRLGGLLKYYYRTAA
jgi:putative transposase